MDITKFDRFDELVKKVEQDGYLKEFCGDDYVDGIAHNMVDFAPEEFKQNLYEYIDGDVVIDKNGLWSFGPFSDIKVDGVSLNDILDYYKNQVLFRQKYSNSWLRYFKYFKRRLAISPQTRVIHPITALRLLKQWREGGYPSEFDCNFGFERHWKCNFITNQFGEPDFVEERYKEELKTRSKLHPAIYGKI